MQYGDTGQSDASRPGWTEHLSHYSEWRAIEKLRIVYFRNFPVTVFRQWSISGTEAAES